MARIAGVDLPKNKRVEVALTYIYGVGSHRSRWICRQLNIDKNLPASQLTDDHISKIRAFIESEFKVEGDLRREVNMSIKRMMDLGCYQGIRHRQGLPVRGQSTRQNARTRKGPRKTVANKKKAV